MKSAKSLKPYQGLKGSPDIASKPFMEAAIVKRSEATKLYTSPLTKGSGYCDRKLKED